MSYIVIEEVDGTQTTLEDTVDVWGPSLYVGSIDLGQIGGVHIDEIPYILGYDGGWIEFEEDIRWEPENEWEQEGEWVPCTRRIYGRAVTGTMIVDKQRAAEPA